VLAETEWKSMEIIAIRFGRVKRDSIVPDARRS
jgi:hypothetical protein